MKQSAASPFHQGEQKIQTLLGVRERMERFGRQVIRDYMPEQHRQFYRQLPVIFIGHADTDGWPWASMLFNEPGFIDSDDPQRLRINARPVDGDPLALVLKSCSRSLRAADRCLRTERRNRSLQGVNEDFEQPRLGLLGIDFESRRRNRLSAQLQDNDDQGFDLQIDQAFGNCPQYIQSRVLNWLPRDQRQQASITDFTELDRAASQLIKTGDTFFVASYVTEQRVTGPTGVDVSHRGGKPGFIRVDDRQTLTIPDYRGNFHFNTLGNFIENPKAGLLFVDFNAGHLLLLTGTVEILWDSADSEFFAGAERLWRFTLDHGRWLKHALPFRWQFKNYSINTELTGTWSQAAASADAEQTRSHWRRYRIDRIINESATVKSFRLSPRQGRRPDFKAGQFVTLKASIDGQTTTRSYSISSAPADEALRISIKHEANGLFSGFMHRQIKVGDSIEIKGPAGHFTLPEDFNRPVVMIAGGIGITPMLSMVHDIINDAISTRSLRPFTLIHSTHNAEDRAFFKELNDISSSAGDAARCYWLLSQIDPTLTKGVDFHRQGRISADFLQALLPEQTADFMLCGPTGFMQSVYDMLVALGIDDSSIMAEAFGPASLQRRPQSKAEFLPLAAAKQALVKFNDSQLEQIWTPDQGSLLEFSEAHGLTPPFACRSGQCGSCKVKILGGRLSYLYPPQVALADDEALLCCSVPAQGDKDSVAVTLAC